MLKEEKMVTEIDAKYVPRVKVENGVWKIDAEGMYYKDLNCLLRSVVCSKGAEKIEIRNVCGQRYIGTDLDAEVNIEIYGTPGNDMGAFMSGPRIVVHGNAQDGCGNTMNDGQIVVHGQAGDLTGHSMRGGKIFVRDDVGYRVGIHMKEYKRKVPNIVIGGAAGDFLAEYMAGGVILVLGLTLGEGERCKARFVGTGIHGGVIYERGDILEPVKGTKIMNVGKRDMQVIERLVKEYCERFGVDFETIMNAKFRKIKPLSKRPYGALYST
jgi:glutamate synthase domain-containing protein 3